MSSKTSLLLLALVTSFSFSLFADESNQGRDKQLNDGKMMYKQLCYDCHDNGEKGAPVLGHRPHWNERIKLGREALLDSIIAGKGFMLPKGGGAGESRYQMGKILDYMVSTVLDENISKSPEMQAQVKRSIRISNGLKLYSENCFSCHNTGWYTTPRLGDKAAWEERKKQPLSTLVSHVIKGHGSMIVKGGNTLESEEEIKSMILYMLSTVEP